MPNKDERAKALVTGGKMKTAGRMNVRYRNASGESFNATVISAGGSSGLKLRVGSNARVIDNVPAATGMKDVNCYFSRQTGTT